MKACQGRNGLPSGRLFVVKATVERASHVSIVTISSPGKLHGVSILPSTVDHGFHADPLKLADLQSSAMDVVRSLNESNLILPAGGVMIGPFLITTLSRA